LFKFVGLTLVRERYPDRLILDFYFVDLKWIHSRAVSDASVSNVKASAVPWAFDLAAIQGTFAERAVVVSATVFKGIKSAHIADNAHALSGNAADFYLTLGKVLNRTYRAGNGHC
jgi:hypothetical protein